MLNRSMIAALFVLVGGCAAQADDESPGQPDDPIAEIEQAAQISSGSPLARLCAAEFRLKHKIDVGDGVKIDVIERFSGRSALQFPRRAVMMLPPTLATNQWFDADIPGDPTYNALHQVARRGFFGFSVSYEGFGESSRPDGRIVRTERMTEQTGKVLEWIRLHRLIPKVDIYGTSIGAGIAIALGGVESPIDRRHVNRIFLSTTVYKILRPETQASYTPAFRAFLLDQPNGYFTSTPATYASAFAGINPEAREWASATLPGQYPVGPTLDIFELPFYEGAPGRAPLKQFYGTASEIAPLEDAQLLSREYGGPYELQVYEGVGHVPILEDVRHRFWNEVEEFLYRGSPSVSLCDAVAPSP